MTKPFFHELDTMQFKAMSALGMTWDEIISAYAAPEWCGMGQEALKGARGCNSLVFRMIRCETDCEGCELKMECPDERA
jgi:hypothetical protein